MYDDVLQRNAAGELELRTVNSTGDTGTNKDDVFTRDSQGRLCVRTTGGGGGGASTAAEVSFDPAGTNYIQSDNVQGALVELDAELKNANDEIDKKVDTAQGADNSGKLLGVGSTGNVSLVDNPVPAGGTAGQVLTKTEDGNIWANVPSGGLPDQTNNKGRLLFTDGASANWSEFFNFGYIESGNQIGACIAGFVSNRSGDSSRGLVLGTVADLEGNLNLLIGSANNINLKVKQITVKGSYNTFVGVSTSDVIQSTNVVVKAPLNGITIQSERTAFFGIDGGFTLNDPHSIYMGTEYNQPYKILDGLTGLIPAERLPKTNYGLKISDTFTQAVNNAATYNLFTTVDLTTDVSLEANMPKSNYSIVDGALKLPTNAGYVDYGIEVRLNGAFAGGENTNREFTIQLQRADGTVISEKAVIKLTGNDLSKRSVVFETYTNTDTDPFIAGGFKLVINNTSGQTLNLTGCDILIKARA